MNIEATANVGLGGFFRVEVRGPSGELKEVREFKNLITDNGMSFMIQNGAVSTANIRCRVGTGNTPPTFADTALAGQLATSVTSGTLTNNLTGTDAGGNWRADQVSIPFAQGAVVGNIAEVGISFDNNTTLHTRALIQDAMGNPTTLTVTAIDQLTVIYQLRMYVVPTIWTGVTAISAVNYSWEIAIAVDQSRTLFCLMGGLSTNAQAGAYRDVTSIGAAGTAIGGVLIGNSTTNTASVNVGTRTVTLGYSWNTGAGNHANGISGVSIIPRATLSNSQMPLTLKCRLSPAIPKTNTQTLSLTFTYTAVRV